MKLGNDKYSDFVPGLVAAMLVLACSPSKSTHSAAAPGPAETSTPAKEVGGAASQSNGDGGGTVDPTTGSAFSGDDKCYASTYKPCLDEHKSDLDSAFAKYKAALGQLKQSEAGSDNAKLSEAQKNYVEKDAGYRQAVSDTGCYAKYDECKVKADPNYRGGILGKDWKAGASGTPAPSSDILAPAVDSSAPAAAAEAPANSGTPIP